MVPTFSVGIVTKQVTMFAIWEIYECVRMEIKSFPHTDQSLPWRNRVVIQGRPGKKEKKRNCFGELKTWVGYTIQLDCAGWERISGEALLEGTIHR